MNVSLDKETFEAWSRKVAERFDHQEKLILSLVGKEMKEAQFVNGERLLDNQDLCLLLQTSKRSLQRYRSQGLIKYQLLRHKVYYRESDVQEFLNENLVSKGGHGTSDH